MPAITEALTNNAGDLSGIGVKIGGAVAGLAAGFSLHEAIDTDEQAIILSRGRVKLDRQMTKEDFDTRRIRKARKLITAKALADDVPARKYMAEYAKIYDAGGKFKFFSMRSIRKIKTNDQISGLPKQRVVFGEDETWELDSSVTWAIEAKGKNTARALLNASNQEEVAQRVVNSSAKVARECLVAHVESRGAANIFSSSSIFESILEDCGSSLHENYGVTLLDYELLSFGPTEAQTSVNGWDRIIGKHFPDPNGLSSAIESIRPLRAVADE